MATAIPAEGARMRTPSWSTPDEQSLGNGSNLQNPSNAPPQSLPPMPSEDHNAIREPENPDLNRASSVGDISMSGGKSDTFRENGNKQVKVLRSFPLSCSTCSLVRLSLFLRLDASPPLP